MAASLVGSVHCAAMCGSFVAVCSSAEHGTKTRLATHASYNLGRLLVYVTLGAVAGAIGKLTDFAGVALGLGRVAAVVTGVLMIAWGLSAMLETQGVRIVRFRLPSTALLVQSALSKLNARHPALKSGILGLSSALLPCGFLYAFVLSAAGSAHPVSGAVIMAAFWLGTVPMMLGLGLLLRGLLGRVRAHVPLLSASLILAVGLFMVVARVNIPLASALQPEASAQSLAPAAMPANCPLHGKQRP
jgi:sulfite exporter TauE/SafE